MNNKRIIYKINNSENVFIIVPSGEIPLEQVIAKDVPQGAEYSVVSTSDIPSERLFRGAWDADFVNKKIITNIPKAKLIAHEKRRVARAKEFAPFDEIISEKIPGEDQSKAEVERQKIRDKYAIIQTNIDSAQNADMLINIVKSFEGHA